MEGREELARALDHIREGDTLMVTRLDRIARSTTDLLSIVQSLNAKKVHFRCLQQGEIDTASGTGMLMLTILGAVAAFENDIRRERQAEGIARAKAAGVYKGRPRSVDEDAVRRLHAEGKRPSAIARQLNIGRASVYRALQSNSAGT